MVKTKSFKVYASCPFSTRAVKAINKAAGISGDEIPRYGSMYYSLVLFKFTTQKAADAAVKRIMALDIYKLSVTWTTIICNVPWSLAAHRAAPKRAKKKKTETSQCSYH